MSNFIFSLGIIGKKLLFPLFYMILYLGINIYYNSIENNEPNLFLDLFGFGTGQILTFFVSNAIKYRRTNLKKKKIHVKNYIKDFLILYVIDTIFLIKRLLPFHVFDTKSNVSNEGEDEENKPTGQLFIIDGIEIIFITLITYFILKYKYYIHHIISIIIFVILCIIIDIILKNYIYTDTYTVISSILVVIADTFIYTYFKYLIANKYYFFLDVLLSIGSFDFVLSMVTISIILISQKINGNNALIFNFFLLYRKHGISGIILPFLISSIFKGFLLGLVEFLILNELTPNYIKIAFELSKTPLAIYSIGGTNRWIILVISIFQILSLLFYLEIFEYNFCELNKNTKKSILDRVHKDFNNDDNDDEIDIKGFDISESIKSQAKKKELQEMSETIEEQEKDD